MLMKLYQTAIFTAVIFADIYWEWGSQGYAIVAVAVFASYILTVGPLKFYDLCMKLQYKIEDFVFRPKGG